MFEFEAFAVFKIKESAAADDCFKDKSTLPDCVSQAGKKSDIMDKHYLLTGCNNKYYASDGKEKTKSKKRIENVCNYKQRKTWKNFRSYKQRTTGGLIDPLHISFL